MCMHFMKTLTVYTLRSHLLISQKSSMLLSSAEIFEAPSTNSEDPDQTAPVGAD